MNHDSLSVVFKTDGSLETPCGVYGAMFGGLFVVMAGGRASKGRGIGRDRRCGRDVRLWLLCGLLFTSLLFYSVLIERQPTGWDALGYQVAGRNIAQGIGPAIEHPFNLTLGPFFSLAAFAVQRPQEPARLYLNYPPGFPLLLAIPQWLGLPDFFALPGLSTLGVFFAYTLGSLLFDRWTGLLGAAIVALTPAYVEWGTSFWADLPGTCFMWGALAVFVAAGRQQECRRQAALGVASGLMVVLAMFIKYSNAVVLLPLFAYAVCTQCRSLFRSWVNWIFLAVVLVGLLGVGLYNQVLYGSPLESHYSASRSGYHFSYFSLSYALGPSPVDGYSLIGAGKTLWANFTWLLVLAALGLAKGTRNATVLLGGLFLIFLGLGGTFAWAPVSIDTRYLLPLFAPIGLFAARGCLAVLELGSDWRRWAFGLVLLAVGVTVLAPLPGIWRRLAERNRASSRIEQVAQDLTAGSELDAVFLAYSWNDPINYFGDRTTLFYRRMDLRDLSKFKNELTHSVTDLLRDGLQVYYVVDRQPPLADSLQILQQNFDVVLWKEVPIPVYRIALKGQ